MADSQIQLSIVLVVLNPGRLLDRTIRSVESQSGFDRTGVELILVDGGSSDGSFERTSASSMVTVAVSEDDEGIYDAMNKGARLANGAWLQYMNAGDVYTESSSLASLLAAAQEADAAWVVGGARHMRGGAGGQPLPIRNVPHSWLLHLIGLQSHCHQACLFRRDVFTAVGGHATQFGTAGDFDLVVKFGLLGRPFEVGSVVIDYLGGGVSEKPALKTAQLLHAVRTDRLALGSRGAAVDRLLGVIVAAVNTARGAIGRIAGGIRS